MESSIFKLFDFIVFWTENINRSSFVYCIFTICAVLSVSNVKRSHTHIFFEKCVITNTVFYEFKIYRVYSYYYKFVTVFPSIYMMIYENKLHLLFMSHHFVAGNRMLTLSTYAIKSWLTLLCGHFLDLLYVL